MIHFLTAFTTACFATATGVFFLLFCLERPVHASLACSDSDSVDVTERIRVLLTLQHFHHLGVPIVVATLITFGTLGAILRLALQGYSPVATVVPLLSALILISALIRVPPALKRLDKTAAEDTVPEISAALVPLLRIHRDGTILSALLVLLQLVAAAL